MWKNLTADIAEEFRCFSDFEKEDIAIWEAKTASRAKAALAERMSWLRLSEAYRGKQREENRNRYRSKYASDHEFRDAEIRKAKGRYWKDPETARARSRERKRRYDQRKKEERKRVIAASELQSPRQQP